MKPGYEPAIKLDSAIDSDDLLAKVEYPDPSTGDASTSAADDVESTYDALGEQLTTGEWTGRGAVNHDGE